ncbi:MAG: CHAT domain-containing protein [Pirellulales bacterium]
MSWTPGSIGARSRHVGTIAAAILLLLTSTAWGQLVPGARDTIPSSEYYAIFEDFHDGNYVSALKNYRQASRGAVKSGNNYWIDSICYQTMAGECCYHMGQYGQALSHYDSALSLYLTHSNWMIKVQFPPVLNPSRRTVVPPWGTSTRGVELAVVPDKIAIAQGSFSLVPQGANIVTQQAPQMRGINVKEIVRCTCLAMRRKREILGPTAPFDNTTDQLVTAMVQPGQPGNWSTCWNDLQLGVAYSLAGKDAQAKPILQRAVLAGGQFDHDMTCVAFFELGRIALGQADFDTAASCFEEASYSAYAFGDIGMVEESLRMGFLTHLMGNRPGLYPPLATLSTWVNNKTPRQLRSSLLLCSAENACVLGQPDAAATALTSLAGLVLKSNLSQGRLGARANFISALQNYQVGDIAKGDRALQLALNFQTSGGSLWLYHMALVDDYYKDNSDKWRTASQLFEYVLRDPTPADWLSDPLEAISSLAAPHPAIYEHWFEMAINPRSKQPDTALEIADALKRHRFLSSTLLGGRTLALRWLLDGPEELLSQKALQEKKDLLTKFPDYAGLSKQAQALQAALRDLPLSPDAPDVQAEQAAKLAELTQITAVQETLLRQISVRREAASIVFPPRIKTKELQEKLPEGTAMLSFAIANHEVWAFLVTKDRYEPWKLGTPEGVRGKISTLLQKMGNHEGNAPVNPSVLEDAGWLKPARDVMTALFAGSRQTLSADLDELIVVPDGVLWYLPFEALPVSKADKKWQPLISQTRIRYAPFCSLALPDQRARPQGKHVAVLSGKLHPSADLELSQQRVNELVDGLPGASLVHTPFPSGSAILSSLFDGLIVFDDLSLGNQLGYSVAPLGADRGEPLSTLDDWLGLPWHGPDQVMLPGFQTAAANSVNNKRSKVEPGLDVFLPVCALMAGGSRTVVLSRWRTGGATSINLTREFAQELPHTTASAAWQRSVQLTMSEPLNPVEEPRLGSKSGNIPETAEHPFFWAGYIVVDTGSPAVRSDAPAEPAPAVVKKPKAKAQPANPADVGEKVNPPAKADADGNDDDDRAPAPAARRGKKSGKPRGKSAGDL